MDRAALWRTLTQHSMTGWLQPRLDPLPEFSAGGRLLWCGIGGSMLPSDALVAALADAPTRARWRPLASPEFEPLELRPSDQLVFASKSGKTLELWTWIGRLRAMEGWGRLDHAPIVVSQDDQNPLARWARAEGFTILPIPTDVGGRFSAFTGIGSLPLAWMGLDPARFVQGAWDVLGEVACGQGPWSDRVWGTVETWHQAYLQGLDHWVFLPYANHLEVAGAWWVQLVAESLGKRSAEGIRRGFIPIRAIGPQDQHAQLQRWLDGPRNVGVMLLTVAAVHAEAALRLPVECPFQGLEHLDGNRILRAQAEGTRATLEAAGIPTLHWELPVIDEADMGALLMAWQLIVGLVGLTLEVDPFDQPAVEAGKRKTMKLLGI